MSIIEIKNLSFKYADNCVFNDLSFEVEQGSFLAILGPNGAGKSTLLNLMCKSLKPTKGSITIDGQNIKSMTNKKLAQKLAVVRQEFLPAFGFSVKQVALMARTPYFGATGFESKNDLQMTNEALEETDTKQFADRLLSQISGGERQRVFIARALTQNSPIMLLDEPTSFLDLKHQVRIYDLLKKMQIQKQKTIVAVTHDINLAAQYCDKILLLGPNHSCHMGKPSDMLSRSTVEKVFGVSCAEFTADSTRFFIPLSKTHRNASPQHTENKELT